MRRLKGLSGIEAFNGNTLSDLNYRAYQLGLEMSIPCLGGSDAHHLSDIGRFASIVPDEINSLSGFIGAINNGRILPVKRENGTYMELSLANLNNKCAEKLKAM